MWRDGLRRDAALDRLADDLDAAVAALDAVSASLRAALGAMPHRHISDATKPDVVDASPAIGAGTVLRWARDGVPPVRALRAAAGALRGRPAL